MFILVTGGAALCCVTIAHRGNRERLSSGNHIVKKKSKEITDYHLTNNTSRLRKLRGVDEQLCLFDLVKLHKSINQDAHLRRLVQRRMGGLIFREWLRIVIKRLHTAAIVEARHGNAEIVGYTNKSNVVGLLSVLPSRCGRTRKSNVYSRFACRFAFFGTKFTVFCVKVRQNNSPPFVCFVEVRKINKKRLTV